MSSETTSSTGYNIERLMDHNYRSWAQQMELILDEKELWEVVNYSPSTSATISAETTMTATTSVGTADLTRKRKRAAALIMSTVSSGVLVYLRGEKDPFTMWTILRDRYAPRTRITNQYKIWVEGRKDLVISRDVLFDDGPRGLPTQTIVNIPQIYDEIIVQPPPREAKTSTATQRGPSRIHALRMPKQ
jgi:Domain of unknown function (DUF4219)